MKQDTSKLERKINQAWEMAGLARQDRDYKDADRWTKEARRLTEVLRDTVLSKEN